MANEQEKVEKLAQKVAAFLEKEHEIQEGSIQLENLIFIIRPGQQKKADNDHAALENEQPIKFKCYKNEQNQWVCPHP